jgi:hypothetical protein
MARVGARCPALEGKFMLEDQHESRGGRDAGNGGLSVRSRRFDKPGYLVCRPWLLLRERYSMNIGRMYRNGCSEMHRPLGSNPRAVLPVRRIKVS